MTLIERLYKKIEDLATASKNNCWYKNYFNKLKISIAKPYTWQKSNKKFNPRSKMTCAMRMNLNRNYVESF